MVDISRQCSIAFFQTLEIWAGVMIEAVDKLKCGWRHTMGGRGDVPTFVVLCLLLLYVIWPLHLIYILD